jgi:hypothetical protein
MGSLIPIQLKVKVRSFSIKPSKDRNYARIGQRDHHRHGHALGADWWLKTRAVGTKALANPIEMQNVTSK